MPTHPRQGTVVQGPAPLGATLDPLYSVDEAAKLLGISAWTLRQWLSQGRIGSVKLGRLRKLRSSDLHAFITASVQPAREIR
jgi:excisionase family DNA binding protein